ncbi:MAG TPA: aminotransferase class III-fold pyridoxal phosphate-dependent enzyme [Candidatus Angelobacter sp.]|nr:aminotransferase class III-fold pyridoxal phosphate-dependent enzyme [Candidatus Angelobacter sp.]
MQSTKNGSAPIPLGTDPDVVAAYSHHCRPELARMLHSLSLDAVYERAEGDYLWQRRGDKLVKVLDLVGGFGTNFFGHYHPELVAEERRLTEQRVPFLAQGSCRLGATRLAEALCERAGDYVAIFTNSGTETVEAAIKHVMLERPKPLLLAIQGAFHGKTTGSIQLTYSYREPYAHLGPEVRFLDMNDPADWRDAEASLEEIAAIFIEPILGEGGVRPLPAGFVAWLKKIQSEDEIPIVADEIQSGFYRAGSFLASQDMGLEPDYICMSKALGGGLAKIGALLVRRDRFIEEFSIKHTSTFAEDDRGCFLAVKAIEIAERDHLGARAKETGNYMLERLREVQSRFPNLIKDVRGRGLMLGVELHDISNSPSNAIRMLCQQEFLGYLAAAYLLNVHCIRVAPTLSERFTLRLQPSAYIERKELDRFLDALQMFCKALEAADVPHLTGYQVGCQAKPIIDYSDRALSRREQPRTENRVAFIGHLLQAEHAVLWDASLIALAPHLAEFMARPSRILQGTIYDQLHVQSSAKGEVHLSYIGLDLTPKQIMEGIYSRDTQWMMDKIENAVELARDNGCRIVGLGAYTSILSGNCKRIQTPGTILTSGNSLTVGMAMEAMKQAAQESGIELKKARLAILGATGNIGATLALMMAPQVENTVLVVRDLQSPRVKSMIEEIARAAGNLEVTDDLYALRKCNMIAAASNSPEPLIRAEHLSEGPVVVCDVAVPADVSADVMIERPLATVIRGGLVRLPHNPDFVIAGLDLEPGYAYACMAETLLMGLEGVTEPVSFGPIKPEGVQWALNAAKKHGFALGKFERTGSMANGLKDLRVAHA